MRFSHKYLYEKYVNVQTANTQYLSNILKGMLCMVVQLNNKSKFK